MDKFQRLVDKYGDCYIQKMYGKYKICVGYNFEKGGRPDIEGLWEDTLEEHDRDWETSL